MPANLENSAVATGLEKVNFIPISKKGNAKECKNYHTIALISHTSMVKAMAPHSSTLAWKITWIEEPGGAAVHGVTKSRTRLRGFTFIFHFQALEKEMATHSSPFPGKSRGQRSMVGYSQFMGSQRVRHD